MAASAALGVGVQAVAYVRDAQDLLRTVAFVSLQLGVLGASVHFVTTIRRAIRTISGDQPPGLGPAGAEGPTRGSDRWGPRSDPWERCIWVTVTGTMLLAGLMTLYHLPLLPGRPWP